MVNDEKQMFHCFGCGEGGDVIHFVMKCDGLSFSETVRELAGRAGLSLPQEGYGEKERSADEARERRRKWGFRANELARGYFCESLRDSKRGSEGRAYLQKRGVSEALLTQHFLGYADKEWDSLAGFLTSKNVPLDLAEELGLIRRRDGGGYYDFFRHRLIFPIHAPDGSVIGFGGRTLDEAESAKYLNSPDSFIYHKSNSVYGLERAKDAIRKENAVLIVEGYMDALALCQSGFAHAVAPLGTALTEGHVRLLMRFTRNILLVFDGDEAGGKAHARALPLFLEMGLMPRVVMLPEGEDPDSFVRSAGPEAFAVELRKARSLFEYFIDWTLMQTGFDAAGSSEATKQILPWLKRLADPVERSMYSGYLARRINVEQQVIDRSLGERGEGIRVRSERERPEKIVIQSAEKTIVQAMLRSENVITKVFEVLAVEDFLDPWCHNIIRLLHDEWRTIGKVEMQSFLESIDDAELQRELRAISMEESHEEDLLQVIDDCLRHMKRRTAEEHLLNINNDIRRAEVEKDDNRLFELLTAKRELAQGLKKSSH